MLAYIYQHHGSQGLYHQDYGYGPLPLISTYNPIYNYRMYNPIETTNYN